MTVANVTSGRTIFSKTVSFTMAYSPGMETTRFLLDIPTTSYSVGVSCAINTNTGNTNCMLSKNPDVARQGTVNIVDICTIAIAFDSTPNDSNWNSNADLNGDGIVNISDIAIAAINYGAPVVP